MVIHVHPGCGGTIEVAPGFPTIVEYRLNETYENNEFCLWGITSVGGWGFVTIVIESDGTQTCCDGVESYYVNTTSTNRDIGLEKCDLYVDIPVQRHLLHFFLHATLPALF